MARVSSSCTSWATSINLWRQGWVFMKRNGSFCIRKLQTLDAICLCVQFIYKNDMFLFQEIECTNLQTLLFSMHAFLSAKLASVDPAFLMNLWPKWKKHKQNSYISYLQAWFTHLIFSLYHDIPCNKWIFLLSFVQCFCLIHIKSKILIELILDQNHSAIILGNMHIMDKCFPHNWSVLVLSVQVAMSSLREYQLTTHSVNFGNTCTAKSHYLWA